jgi:RNA polymerase sigma-70 factor (ECF subfamily)
MTECSSPDWMHPAAHDALFRAFAPRLSAFVARYVGNAAVAEDLVQDLFLTMWADRARMRVAGSVRTYLFTAARNRALNYLKRERLAGRFRADWTDAPDPSAPGESDLLTRLAVERALDALPPRRRRIFALRRIADLSHTQIATRLGISVKTVEVQMGRALKSLKCAPIL